MKTTGILLIIWGILGFLMGSLMFGDIGIACIVGAVTAIACGVGFLQADKQIKRLWKNRKSEQMNTAGTL